MIRATKSIMDAIKESKTNKNKDIFEIEPGSVSPTK